MMKDNTANNSPVFPGVHISPVMLIVFFATTFALTWSFLFPAVKSTAEANFILLIIPAAFGPFLSAVLTLAVFRGKKILKLWLKQVFKFRVPVLLYLAGAFLLPLVFGGGHLLLYGSVGGQMDFSGAAPWYLYLFSLIPTALLTGGNEEPGWRGFALPGLLQVMNPVLAALILGLIHAAWHLPLMNHYQTNIFIYAYNVVGLTFMLNWFYMRSRWSIYPVMLLHAATNVIGGFIPTPEIVLDGVGTDLFLRGTVYWAIAVNLLIITRGELGLKSPVEASRPQHQILVSTRP